MSLGEQLQTWIVQETGGLGEGRMKSIPHISTLNKLTDGKNKRIWNYVISHVKSRRNVEHIKNVLRVKRAQSELSNLYPRIQRHDSAILKQEILKSEEKVLFVESSLRRIETHLFKLKKEIQDVKKANCIIMQKRSILELVVLHYQQKNEMLRTILENLTSLLNGIFSAEKTKCFQHLISFCTLELSKTNKLSVQPVDVRIKNIIYQMSSAIGKKLSNEDKKKLTTNCVKSIIEIMGCTTSNDFVIVLKELSIQSEDSLKRDNFLLGSPDSSVHKDEQRDSDKCLQDLKFSLVDCSFRRIKIASLANELKEPEEILSSEKFSLGQSEIQHVFLAVKIENECLRESINYMEEALSDEFQTTKCLVEKNSVQRAECENLKSIMKEFHQNLESMHILLDKTAKIFTDLAKSLISSNECLHTFSLESDVVKLFSDVQHEMKSDYKMSLELLKSKCLFKSLLFNSDFESTMIPQEIWESLAIKPFQNWRQICEKISNIKMKLSVPNNDFKFETGEEMIEGFCHKVDILTKKTEELKFAETKFLPETKQKSKNLKDIMEEWSEQKAQFIPSINYDGKSLKMWIDILCILEDF